MSEGNVLGVLTDVKVEVTWRCPLNCLHCSSDGSVNAIEQLDPGQFDCALIGFLLSHLTSQQEIVVFQKLKSLLKPAGHFLVLDSAWNKARAETRQKEGMQWRTLNDGRQFQIYKKYFDKNDFSCMQDKHGVQFVIEHVGRAFIAARGELRKGR